MGKYHAFGAVCYYIVGGCIHSRSISLDEPSSKVRFNLRASKRDPLFL